MTDLRKAAEMALEALESSRVFITSKEKIKHPDGTEWYDERIQALRQALAQPEQDSECNPTDLCAGCRCAYSRSAQPEQEPVAWIESLEKPQPRCVTNLKYRSVAEVDAGVQYIPLYTATPEQWVELTDSEILEIEQDSKVFDYLIPHLFARSIETKLKEKNT